MTGVVDLKTGKIVGVKEGTREYYHEEGHIAYNNSEKGIKNSLRQQWILEIFFVSLIGSIVWDYFVFLSGILFIVYKGYDWYEERWCWNYADEKLQKSI